MLLPRIVHVVLVSIILTSCSEINNESGYNEEDDLNNDTSIDTSICEETHLSMDHYLGVVVNSGGSISKIELKTCNNISIPISKIIRGGKFESINSICFDPIDVQSGEALEISFSQQDSFKVGDVLEVTNCHGDSNIDVSIYMENESNKFSLEKKGDSKFLITKTE